jgi:hypothetical protein
MRRSRDPGVAVSKVPDNITVCQYANGKGHQPKRLRVLIATHQILVHKIPARRSLIFQSVFSIGSEK